jgi:hypothetical protein
MLIRRHPLFTFRGILLFILIIGPLIPILIHAIYPNFRPEFLFIWSFTSTLFFFLFSYGMNYVIIDHKSIKIKHQLKPWAKQTIAIDDILSVTYRDRINPFGRLPIKGIVFEFKNNSLKAIAFSSFNGKEWRLLFDEFKKMGIIIDADYKSDIEIMRESFEEIGRILKKK